LTKLGRKSGKPMKHEVDQSCLSLSLGIAKGKALNEGSLI